MNGRSSVVFGEGLKPMLGRMRMNTMNNVFSLIVYPSWINSFVRKESLEGTSVAQPIERRARKDSSSR